MNFFIVKITYIAPMERVAEVRPGHRAHLGKAVERGMMLVGGPLNPPTGGLLIMRSESRESLESFLADDPFYREGVAEASIEEFTPVTIHSEVETFFAS